jgi:hypothetical protein
MGDLRPSPREAAESILRGDSIYYRFTGFLVSWVLLSRVISLLSPE